MSVCTDKRIIFIESLQFMNYLKFEGLFEYTSECFDRQNVYTYLYKDSLKSLR